MSGWISIHRKVDKHWLWEDKPFSKGQAWIDILMMVNHEDGKTLMGNGLVDVKRGSRITSIRKLCDRWGWSNTKVKSFLKLLEEDKMLIAISDTKKTTLTVVNYNDYQRNTKEENDTETSEEHHENDTKALPKHTNNNVNNVNNVNNGIIEDAKPPKIIKSKYGEFEKVKLSEEEHIKLLDKLGQALTDDLIVRLDSYKASTGKTYKSDYATILNWSRKEIKSNELESRGKSKTDSGESPYDYDKFFN